jgi:midasin
VSDFAVILEGPTSAGKTSCIQYLAAVTHNKCIRINNHMHTDVQEYVGSYVPDTEAGGKLVFREGALVEAVRNGYWVILDELNLAPSEVLEALNRLLDDNREVNIIETQTVIKAHPRFRIFATQNPTEGYGGRKELSEAFKNRFVLIRVADVPTDELEEILVKKCDLPPSRASLMVKTMEAL